MKLNTSYVCNKFFVNILLIFGVLIVCLINIDVAYAYNQAGTGVFTKPNSCGIGGYCWRSTAGMRITIVNENGDRCAYNKSKGKLICSTSDSDYSSSSKSKSIDYWWNPKQIDSTANTNCKAFSTKRIKKEFSADKSSKTDFTSGEVVNCSDEKAYKFVYDFSDIGLPELPDVPNDKISWSPDDEDEKPRIGTNIPNIINYLECSVSSDKYKPMSFDKTDKGEKYQLNCSGVDKTNEYINNIFKNAFGLNTFDISQINIEGAYIQFEQLVFLVNSGGPAKVKNFAFMGSIAEVSYLYRNYFATDFKKRWSVITTSYDAAQAHPLTPTNKKNINSQLENYNSGSSALKSGIFNGWYNDVKTGTGLNVKDFTDFSDYIYKDGNHISPTFDLNYYYQNNTRNVLSMWLTPTIGQPPCDSEVATYLSTHDKTTLDGLNKYLRGKNIKELDSYKGSNMINVAYAKIGGILNEDVSNYCSYISCGDILASTKKDYASLKKLHEFFNSYDYIDPDFLNEMGIDYKSPLVSCKKAPECPVSSSTFHCNTEDSDESSTGNSLTLKDNDDTRNCLSQGIAYNGLNDGGNFIKKSTQTSFDREYGTDAADDGPGYCYEEVTFDFPGNASAKAGKLLKWGTINDISNNTFGTMIVHRICYLSEGKKASGTSITSNWADVIDSNFITANNYGNIAVKNDARINPIIELNYVQAVPEKYRDGEHQVKNYRIKEKLKVYLSEFLMTDNGGINHKGLDGLNWVKYDINGKVIDINEENIIHGNNPRTTTGTGIDYVDMTATYQIVYDNNLKWYSDKSDQFALKRGDNSSEIDNPSYVAVGYGLPTSFITPSNPISKAYGYEYALNSNDSGGKLSVTVSNIGTSNATGGYHFDKMIEFALEDDDPSNTNSIVYSCGFNIQNELFGYECGDHGEKCSSTCDTPGCDNECPNGVCDAPKGIDVVFRTVDLISSEADIKIAFPGRSGNGRERGRNWAEIADSDVAQILRNDVYNNDPMYELTLDAGTIQRIREYNSRLDNPYINMTEYDENYGSEGNGYEGYTYSKSNGDSVLDKCRKFTSFADIINGNYAKCLNEARESLRSKSESSSATGPVASNFIKYLIDSEEMIGRCAIKGSNNDRIKSIITGCGRDD